jgi:hypothetical protein
MTDTTKTKTSRSSYTRRGFLGGTAGFLSSVGLAQSMAQAASNPLPMPHFKPRAKRLVWLYMAGGPSHLETFDPKPELAKRHGQVMPTSITRGKQLAQLQGKPLTIMRPQFNFQRYGKSGQHMSDLFPHMGRVADELCVIRSMKTEAINHDPAHTFMNTGTVIAGRPSLGSWLLYGLGSESQNLPGFVAMVVSGKGGMAQPVASRQWHSGFLPGHLQGVRFQTSGDPVPYLQTPAGIGADSQHDVINAVNSLDNLRNGTKPDAELQARVAQYQMAFRMQSSVPELLDTQSESKSTFDLYGTDGKDGSFAAACLKTRRMLERGVRVVQIYHRDWDHHEGLKANIEINARETDRGCAALLTDLKQRGLLEDTLVVWGGEFGRTPMAQGDGRDHHINGFSYWLAGAGVQGGTSIGATDDFGYEAVSDVVHVHDLHATILHLMGLDHQRLTYRHQGRDFRLTDVAGNVVKAIVG